MSERHIPAVRARPLLYVIGSSVWILSTGMTYALELKKIVWKKGDKQLF